MPFVSARCTYCGANLNVDSAKDAAICEYCGTPFIVEKAINNYNTINNIKDSIVHIHNGSDSDFDIRGGVLIKYNGESLDPVVPDTVIEIGEYAFSHTRIKKATISKRTKIIGNNSFKCCEDLKEVTLPNGLTRIDFESFAYCDSLSSINLPDNVSLATGVFRSCNSLTSISLPKTLTYIPHYLFHSCSSLSKVTIPDNITSIGCQAFAQCSHLTEIILPAHIQTIGYQAFAQCPHLTKIILPDHIQKIESDINFTPNFSQNTTIYINSINTLSTIIKNYPISYRSDNKGRSRRRTPFDGCKNVIVNGEIIDITKYIKSQEKACYITTAICEAENKPDDCAELTAFRTFRDEWLLQQEGGQELINEYYETAPKIVEAINHKENAKEIYASIKEKYLDRCFQSLQKNDPHACKKIYIDMVRKLEKEYLH